MTSKFDTFPPHNCRLHGHTLVRVIATLRFFLTFCVATAVLWIGASVPVYAHPTAHSTMIVNVDTVKQHVDVLASVNAVDLAEFLRLDANGDGEVNVEELEAGHKTVRAYLLPRIEVTNNSEACSAAETRFVPSAVPEKEINFVQRWKCNKALDRLQLANRILFDDIGGHRHQTKVQVGADVVPMILSRENPTYTVDVLPDNDSEQAPPQNDEARSMLSFVWEGILHILIGLDHVLFVITLLVVARDLRKLAVVISSFTVGHSITLALAATGTFTLPASIIEPLIALSIVVVCAENMFRSKEDPGEHRILLTGAFGLIHGFGFSYVLAEDVGLPSDEVFLPLLMFNVGVELGQLGIVAVVYPVLRRFMDHARYRYVVWGVSGVVLALALYWVVERSLELFV